MSILDDKRDISQHTIGDLVKNQKILSNRSLLMKNLEQLIDNLNDCEEYIHKVIAKKEVDNPEIGRMLNKCLG